MDHMIRRSSFNVEPQKCTTGKKPTATVTLPRMPLKHLVVATSYLNQPAAVSA